MLHLLINPTAGNGRSIKYAQEVMKHLSSKGILYEAQYTSGCYHATEICNALAAQKVQTVISVGGDGTSLEAASGLIGTQTVLGILPAGTGNDFARCLGIPTDPIQAIDALLSATPTHVDMASINGKPFLNVCGAGFDARVVAASRQVRLLGRGMLPYLYGVVHTLIENKSYDMHVTVDGTSYDGRMLLCEVANGQYIGGGMQMAPMADPSDGCLDLVFVDAISRRKILALLPKMIKGNHMQYTQHVHHVRCKEVVLSCKNMLIQCDGEILPLCDEARFALLPDSIKILVPSKS